MREMEISEKRIMYRAKIPKTAKTRSKFRMMLLMEPMQILAIVLKLVWHLSIVRVCK